MTPTNNTTTLLPHFRHALHESPEIAYLLHLNSHIHSHRQHIAHTQSLVLRLTHTNTTTTNAYRLANTTTHRSISPTLVSSSIPNAHFTIPRPRVSHSPLNAFSTGWIEKRFALSEGSFGGFTEVSFELLTEVSLELLTEVSFEGLAGVSLE